MRKIFIFLVELVPLLSLKIVNNDKCSYRIYNEVDVTVRLFLDVL